MTFAASFTNCSGLMYDIMGLTMILGYQFLLYYKDLVKYIYSDERAGILASNKEGVLGSIGFISIYFFGLSIGQKINSRTEAKALLQFLAK